MWASIVAPAAWNVGLLAQPLCRHRAALDVPAGTPTPPWRIPPNVAIRFVPRFPKRKIANVFLLVLIAAHASGWPQLFQIQMRQLPVIGKFVDPKINGFVFGLIGETTFDQFGNHLDHAREVARFGRAT